MLLIVVDQLTAALTGVYGHPVVRTPHLDQLAAEGVRFQAAYSNCPVCGPARGALMSGQYVSNCGVYDNAAAWPQDMVTLPHYLTLAGYDTVLSGKMHFVGADQLHGFRKRLVHNIYPADFKWTPARQDPFNVPEGEEPEFRPTGGQAGQYVGDAIHVGEWRNTLSYDEETHFRALEYLHAKGAERQRKARVAGREFEDLDTMRGRKAGSQTPSRQCDAALFPLRLLPPPPRALLAAPALLGHVRGAADPGARNTPQTWSDLLDAGPLAERLSRLRGLRPDRSRERRARAAGLLWAGHVRRRQGGRADGRAGGERAGPRTRWCSLPATTATCCAKRGWCRNAAFTSGRRACLCIARLPGGEQARTVETPVSLIDLLPTILDLAGVEERLPYDGRSLLPLIEGQRGPRADRLFRDPLRGHPRALLYGAQGPLQVHLCPRPRRAAL